LASGAGDQLFRDEWGGGVGDLARDGCCLVSSMIASPEHGWLGGAAVLVRNGAICAEPLGALPLGLGQADALAVDGLTAAPGTVAGRTAGGLPLNRPAAGGVAASRLRTWRWRNHGVTPSFRYAGVLGPGGCETAAFGPSRRSMSR